MKSMNPVYYIEIFHLIFLEHLGRKVDKKLTALKCGCNLRFFLKSIRYSQDIDFDVQIVRSDTLRKVVNSILHSAPFSMILRTKNIEIKDCSEPKQTETTQRWKISLSVKGTNIPLHTKIEFSRREWKEAVAFESVDPLIIQHYQLMPFFANHYTPLSALHQKIEALALRNQTQARDIFDIYHLIKMGVRQDHVKEHFLPLIQKAESNALSLSFGEFKSQVIAYLPYEYQALYDDPHVWENMVLSVVEGMKNETH